MKDNSNYCITCKYKYNISIENGKPTKICFDEEKTDIVEELTTSEDISFNNSTINILDEDEITTLYKYIKKNYINKNYNGSNIIIKGKNVVFHFSKYEDQKNSYNQGISSINLQECEERLKTVNDIKEEESLFILKIDIISEDLIQTYVQYEIYNPKNFTLLDLSVCQDITIIMNSPVYINNLTSLLYDYLKESGYNLFNKSDDFYNDICSTFTTENGTDIILFDRKNIIYENNGNISLCQRGCELDYYNSTNKKAKCDCSPQINKTETILSLIYDKFKSINISDIFIDTLKNSNFLVLKCYKLAFDLKTIWTNIGRIIMTIILILSLIFLFIFCFYDNNNINKYIENIYRSRLDYFKNHDKSKELNKNQITKNKFNNRTKQRLKTESKKIKKQISFKKSHNSLDKILNIRKKDKNKIINEKKSNIFFPPKKNNIYNKDINHKRNNDNNNISFKNLLNEDKQNHSGCKKKNHQTNINIINIKSIKFKGIKKNEKSKKVIRKESDNKLINNQKNIKKKTTKSSFSQVKFNLNKNKELKQNKPFKNDKNLNQFNDQELNNLDYKNAVIIDKRNYLQYYWSLLKKKQLLLFTFYPSNDYNLKTMKICLFLLSFSLYLTINAFFFSDETMHKIYEDKGIYNIIYQMPQILYSSIISAVINIVLKQFSLSEKKILTLKEEKDYKMILGNSKNIRKCLTIKFTIFFILNYLLLFFFWYYITCFCAVYINTQKILFKDTLTSFSLSMLYPFGLNLIPGIFRIPSLKAKNKDKECIYKIGLVFALI